MDEMVMRSVYLRPLEDNQLRQLAHEKHVTKSDLIRSAISAKLKEWLDDGGDATLTADLELGRRDSGNAPRTPISAAAFAAMLENELGQPVKAKRRRKSIPGV